MLSWGQTAWIFFNTFYIYLEIAFQKKLSQLTWFQQQWTLKQYLIFNFDWCEFLSSFSLKVLSPTHLSVFSHWSENWQILTLHSLQRLFRTFNLPKDMRDQTTILISLCKEGLEGLSDFSKVSWPRGTDNAIKTKATFLPSPVLLVYLRISAYSQWLWVSSHRCLW